MARAGGEAGKLGDRYEAIWTVDNLLDLITGDAVAMTVEPFGADAIGIEFWKVLPNGIVEHHSAKRQTTGATWTLYELTHPEETGRSILGDLLAKQKADTKNRAVFVSATTANELNELWERASRSADAVGFAQQLDTSAPLHKKFDDYLEPLCRDLDVNAFEMLRRVRVVGITESELIRQVEFKIRMLFYRSDDADVDPTVVRLLLADIVLKRLGQALDKKTLLAELQDHGFHERDWSTGDVRDTVENINRGYLRIVEAELINGRQILRSEATGAFEKLIGESETRFLTIAGPAGGGKTCSLAQVAGLLGEKKIPYLIVRLDIQTGVLTSAALGKELGLPHSPVGVLAGITNGGQSVLIIDQLDALSFASGRHQQLWAVFQELLAEAERYPNLHVLIACRVFDIENDPRLRRLLNDTKRSVRIDIGLLDLGTVNQIVADAGIDPAALGARRIEMLRVPLHLSLYLQGNPGAHGPFDSVQDLYRRYWDEKRSRVAARLGRDPRWMEIIETLAAELSNRQTLSAPEDVLDAYAQDAQIMASEHVLVRENRRYRFFHEGFFDYAFARCFVQKGQPLVDWLVSSEQHLFRRAQVRQSLAYQRDREMADYLRDLRAVLTDSRVRFHIKKLVLQWLRVVTEPTEAEWDIVQSLWSDAQLGRHVRLVPHDSVPWFDLLDRSGVWQHWLASSEPEEVDHAIWLLSLPEVMKGRSGRIAALVEPYRASGGEWPARFEALLIQGQAYRSREMFNFLLDLLADGSLDRRFHWGSLYRMPREKPEWAAELIAHHIDHLHETALKLGHENPFTPETKLEHVRPEFIRTTATNTPTTFVHYLLPRVVYLVVSTEATVHDRTFDRIWAVKVFGRDYTSKDALLSSLARAMADMAKREPDRLDEMTLGLDELPHETISFLLETAWAGNPARYADQAAAYLLADTARFEIGYSMWSRGSGAEAISCDLLRAITPQCSDALYSQLEAAILHRNTRAERELPQSAGITELHLLDSIAPNRLSDRARKRMDELRRKFPGVRTEPPQPLKVVEVKSPIAPDAIKKMTDEQWLRAMAKYAGRESDSAKDFLKGNVHQLSGELEAEARQDKARFAELGLKMDDHLHQRYFSAILKGIVTEQLSPPAAQAGAAETSDTVVQTAPPLPTAKIVEVIERLHALPDKPCGIAICRAVADIAERDFPHRVFEIVSNYATNDLDPQEELWKVSANTGSPYYGGNALMHGINTVRGAAAHAVSQLLFADPKRFPKLEEAITSLVSDRTLAVRACVVEVLLALMNTDRERAIALFLDLCHGAEEILATPSIDRFLYYATFRHYSMVRPLLRQMLASADPAVQEIAARQICLASLHDEEAAGDLHLVNEAGEKARAAATEIYAANLGQKQVADTCRERLQAAFHDPCKEVREAAAGCFRRITDTQLSQEAELIGVFIDSPAFVDGVNELLFAIEDSVMRLPDVVCRIPERAIELQRNPRATEGVDQSMWTHMMPPLVLRLYEQTTDHATKARCLNLIDEMIELDFGSIQTELVKIER